MDFMDGFLCDQVAGIDEAGRGPLAGPVVAAAVVLSPLRPIEGLKDSKKLSEKKREHLFDIIMAEAHAVGVGQCSSLEVDQYNILQATWLAMQRAYQQLNCKIRHVLVDGNATPNLPVSCEAVIKGDQKVACISAASIIAKVTRDRQMLEYANTYPQYIFEKHKGYGTKLHMERLSTYGPTPIHRMSFAPVRRAAGSGELNSVE
jgi:ribonuclease HII